MSSQRDRKRATESTRLKLQLATNTAGNVLIDNCHDYASTAKPLTAVKENMDEFPPLSERPDTPSKPPALKKMLYTPRLEKAELNDIVASLVSLSALINTRSDNIESMVSANEGLKKTIDFVCAEISDVKGRVCTLYKKMA